MLTVAEIDLHFSTGDDVVDRVLRGYVAAFQAAFPGRLRCFVVAGGYAAAALAGLAGHSVDAVRSAAQLSLRTLKAQQRRVQQRRVQQPQVQQRQAQLRHEGLAS